MIRIGILGYGNLGRGVENAIRQNDDMELTAVFTRRNPDDLKIATETAKVYSVDDAEKMADQIDVMILCGGSATDLPVQTPEYAKYFTVVDSFDTHARIPEHFAAVDAAAKAAAVQIQGVERNRLGAGACVKMRGSISDVKAAMEVAIRTAEPIAKVVSHTVIASPSEETETAIAMTITK